jgi:hypothetical protein
MRLLASILILLSLLFPTHSQIKVYASKVAELDREVPNETFVKTVKAFISKLAKSPDGTTGFIAIAGDALTREKIARTIIKKSPKVRQRIEISRAGTRYNKNWDANEFWLIPRGAERPYIPKTGDCDCPQIEVSGKEKVTSDTKEVFFSVSISGANQDSLIRYRWTVSGGTVISGQGTPMIAVRPKSTAVIIKAEVKLAGLAEKICNCLESASFTTKIEDNQE